LGARAIEEGAADLFAARRAGANIGDAGLQLELEATRVGELAAQTGALRATLTVDPAGREP
jgi:hypothetical protein